MKSELELTANVADILPARKDMEERSKLIKHYYSVIMDLLVEGVDYGKGYEGQPKPSLFKSGAEKIALFFGCRQEYELIKVVENLGEEAFFYFRYECRLIRISDNQMLAHGQAITNSKEKKFVKLAKGNNFELPNNLLKMSEKRAFANAALALSGLSDKFTQDFDEIEYDPVAEEVQNPLNKAQIVEMDRYIKDNKISPEHLMQIVEALKYKTIMSPLNVDQKDYKKVMQLLDSLVTETSIGLKDTTKDPVEESTVKAAPAPPPPAKRAAAAAPVTQKETPPPTEEPGIWDEGKEQVAENTASNGVGKPAADAVAPAKYKNPEFEAIRANLENDGHQIDVIEKVFKDWHGVIPTDPGHYKVFLEVSRKRFFAFYRGELGFAAPEIKEHMAEIFEKPVEELSTETILMNADDRQLLNVKTYGLYNVVLFG